MGDSCESEEQGLSASLALPLHSKAKAHMHLHHPSRAAGLKLHFKVGRGSLHRPCRDGVDHWTTGPLPAGTPTGMHLYLQRSDLQLRVLPRCVRIHA